MISETTSEYSRCMECNDIFSGDPTFIVVKSYIRIIGGKLVEQKDTLAVCPNCEPWKDKCIPEPEGSDDWKSPLIEYLKTRNASK
jgi:hypothetical protein